MSKLNKKELHELFNNLKNKDQNAYNLLYEKYYSLVYGIVFSIIKNKADAEDITHEIFTKIYKLDVNKLPSENEASWLYTVCKNECFLFIRKSKPNISIDEIYEMPDNTSGIDEIVDREYFNKLISGLKEDEKMIVSLKVLSNFTFKKISQVMNIPIGTVQWKYYNAINSLKISIGSLVGAIMAFVLVCANGDFWKKKNYVNKVYDEKTENRDNYYENADLENTTKEDMKDDEVGKSEESSSYINEGNTNKSVINNNENINNTINEETISKVEQCDQNTGKINAFQISFLAIGFVLLTIFLIFFKIYQQKLRKKSSK